MNRIATDIIAAFDYGYGYIVEITLDIERNVAGAWLYHKEYSVKIGMFAAHIAEGETIENFIEIVEAALPEHIALYFSDYMDGTDEEAAALDAIMEGGF